MFLVLFFDELYVFYVEWSSFEGKVFLYSHRERKIDQVIRFSNSGDYEGIATIGNRFFVAESNGDIHKFERTDNGDAIKIKKYNTRLNKDNNVEGLTYDHQLKKLIVACKDNAGVKDKKEKWKRERKNGRNK